MSETRSPPVHLHVQENTPVHVHMKRHKWLSIPASSYLEAKLADGRGRQMAKHRRSRSSAAHVPWVPAPARTTRSSSQKREDGNHENELDLVHKSDLTMQRSELDTEDELWANAASRAYEKKLGGLMDEVGALKSEVDRQRTLRASEKKDKVLDESLRALENHEAALLETQKALHGQERENRRLRGVVTTLKSSEATTHRNGDSLASVEREHLLRKLVEAELDGQAVAEQAALLHSVANSLFSRGSRQFIADSAAIRPFEQHHDLLVQKLCDFDETNRELRRLLEERHGNEAEATRLTEQRSLLVEKLTIADEENEKLRCKILESERKLVDMSSAVDTAHEESLRQTQVEYKMAVSRHHVELQARETELAHLTARAVAAESEAAGEHEEAARLRRQMQEARDKYSLEKDALKKASRLHKQRAASNESSAHELASKLDDMTMRLAELQVASDTLHVHHDCALAEKTTFATENSLLKSRLSELETHVSSLIGTHKDKQDAMLSELHSKNGNIASLKAENDRLKTGVATLEKRLDVSASQVRSLRADLRQLESASDDLKQQTTHSRLAADETRARLHESELLVERLRAESEVELGRVRQRLESRLAELEPLPEMLKISELRLNAANDRLANFEKQNGEKMALLSELTNKVEKQAAELTSWKDRYQAFDSSMQARASQLQSKLTETETRNTDLLLASSRREEALTHAGLKLDRCNQDVASLTRQLDQARADSRRTQDEAKEKAVYKENALMERIHDLDEKLAAAKNDAAKARREKEESERKFNARVFELKERLEQSHSSNKSMQNYVQFLKSSYASVFGDVSIAAGNAPSAAASSPSRSQSRTTHF